MSDGDESISMGTARDHQRLISGLCVSLTASILIMFFTWPTVWRYVRYQVNSARVGGLLARMDYLPRALERYKHDRGQYPMILEQLVPKYAKAVPPPQSPLSSGGTCYAGCDYKRGRSSYVLSMQIVSDPNHVGDVDCFDYVVYEGPGYHPAPEDRPYGRIGKWKYYSAH